MFHSLRRRARKLVYDFFYIKERLEYKRFLSDCKRESNFIHAEREKRLPVDIYPMQKGMLPAGWQKTKPKATSKHHNDFTWKKK